jgi:DNA-binding transcriptional LysR family regulator
MTLLMSKKLKYFIVSYETCCINQAAEQLCVTRSPLTRVLYELEDKTGGKLFHRRYNQLEPTELALELYEKTKPVYDQLCGIENEFILSGKKSLELLCDISVPHIISQHLFFKLKNMVPLVSCRRVSASGSEIQSLLANPEITLFSYRKINTPDNINFHRVREETFLLLLPESLSDEDLMNIEVMNGVKLYIKKESYAAEVKGLISRAVRNVTPYVNIKETTSDTATLLLSVSAGEGMMIIPKSLSSYFSPPNSRQIAIPDVNVSAGLYMNDNCRNKSLAKKVMNIISSISN